VLAASCSQRMEEGSCIYLRTLTRKKRIPPHCRFNVHVDIIINVHRHSRLGTRGRPGTAHSLVATGGWVFRHCGVGSTRLSLLASFFFAPVLRIYSRPEGYEAFTLQGAGPPARIAYLSGACVWFVRSNRAPRARESPGEERVWSELRVARVAVSPPSCANRATTKTCCAPHDSTIPHAHSVLSKVRNKLGRSRQGRWEKLAAARQGSECRTHVEALLERLECGGTRPFLFAGFHASKRGEGRGAGALRHAARGEATMGALGTY